MKSSRELSSSCSLAFAAFALLCGLVLEASPERFEGDIGPNHRRSIAPAASQGRIVEVATGMHYWDGEAWQPSDATFDIVDGAFIARRLQCAVAISAQLNRRASVSIVTRDGVNVLSTPVGIGLYDPVSGESAIIAELKDCIGRRSSTNQVIFENAFSGLEADVIYTISQSTFEQDILIKEGVDPVAYGFDPATARLRLFTELYDPPRPERMRRPLRVEQDEGVRARMVSPDLVDEVLGFGEFVLTTGQAYRSADDQAPLLVAKEILVAEDRVFLVESIEFGPFKVAFASLPSSTEGKSTAEALFATEGGTAPPRRTIPTPRAKVGLTSPQPARDLEFAQASTGDRQGVLVDYIANLGGTLSGNIVFSAFTTYFVSGPVSCIGPTTIEGLSTFKFKYKTAAPYPGIVLFNTLTCKTSPYRMAVFTAEDDDTVGDDLVGWPGSGHQHNPNPTPVRGDGYAKPALALVVQTTATASGLEFRFAKEGLAYSASYGSSMTVANSRFLNCIRGVIVSGCGCWSGSSAALTVKNSLLGNVQYPFTTYVPTSGTLKSCTVDCATAVNGTPVNDARVLTAVSHTASFSSVNGVFAHVDLPPSYGSSMSGSYNGFWIYGGSVPFGSSRRQPPSSPSPFESGARGDYYLNPAQGTYPSNPTSFVNAGNQGSNLEGLYHFTTSVADESKELNTQVDLGAHYPSYSEEISPTDYDRDMKPDLEEDSDGDGIADAGETNWLVFTDADADGLEDSWEILYFGSVSAAGPDGDPDGDGLPNLAEFRLMKQPTLADNPLNLPQLVNGMSIADQLFFVLPLYPQLGRPPVTLWVDGAPSPDAALDTNASGQVGLFFETRHYLNGARSLRVAFQYRSLPPSFGQPTRTFGTQKNVTLSNHAVFNPTASRFERALVVDASLPNLLTANYTVDVFDDQGQLLATTSGQTTDGTILEGWSTVDGQGNPTVDSNLATIITLFPPGSPPIQLAPKWYIQERAALDGRYIIAWGWDTGGSQSHATRKNDMMLDGVINIVGNPALDNEYLLSPAANVPFGSTFRVQGPAEKSILETEFKSAANRNFFWFGHSSSVHLAPLSGDATPVFIMADEIGQWLQNKAYLAMGKPHLSDKYQDKNPYRLAILNGCTTYSRDWAGAFGVDFEPSSTAIYNFLGRTPRAFVGWTTEIVVPGQWHGLDFLDHVRYAEALATMNSYWMGGADLFTCLIEFADKAQANGFGLTPWDFEVAGCQDLVRLP